MQNLNEIMAFMDQYGLFFLFGVAFLEYMNMPGLPAGLLYPAAGFWLSTSAQLFLPAYAGSVLAGLGGSLVLYLIGRLGGPPLLKKIKSKFPRSREKIDLYSGKLRRRAGITVATARVIPIIRTLIALPAGAVAMPLPAYLLFSALGIAVWNGALLAAGFFFGDVILSQAAI